MRYTPEDVKARRHRALASVTRPFFFGDSSTSAPPPCVGGNARSYYVSPRGLPFHYQHYTRNNIYIYPEHRDFALGQM